MREQELQAETEAEATEKLLTGLLLLLLSAYCFIYLRTTCRETALQWTRPSGIHR